MDMNPAHYTLHLATHFAGADRDSLHQCPCFPRTCAYPETMTLEGLMHHLDDVHGLERSQVSSAIEQRSRFHLTFILFSFSFVICLFIV